MPTGCLRRRRIRTGRGFLFLRPTHSATYLSWKKSEERVESVRDRSTFLRTASSLPDYNGIDIPLGDKPHNPLASVGHLQSSVSSRPRPVHFPRLRVAASRSDSKYLDNLGHRPLLYRSIDRSVHPSIHHRGNIGIIFLFSRKRRAKKKRKRRSLSLVRSDLSDIRALNLFLSLSGVEREREREVAERRATRPRKRERERHGTKENRVLEGRNPSRR